LYQSDQAAMGECIVMPCWARIALWHHMSIYGTDQSKPNGQRVFPADPDGFFEGIRIHAQGVYAGIIR